MTLRIAICDDEPQACRALERDIREEFLRRRQIVSIHAYTDPLALLSDAARSRFNVYFLDIGMPRLDGIELARRLRQGAGAREELVVFVSGREEMVFQAIHVSPFRFIRKSRFKEEIGEAVDGIVKAFAESGADAVAFEFGGRMFVLSASRIEYIENINKIQIIHAQDGQYSIKSQIGALEERLAPEGFLRVHKSYLVNFRHIRRFESPDVILKSGVHIPLSKHRAPDVKRRYQQLIQG